MVKSVINNIEGDSFGYFMKSWSYGHQLGQVRRANVRVEAKEKSRGIVFFHVFSFKYFLVFNILPCQTDQNGMQLTCSLTFDWDLSSSMRATHIYTSCIMAEVVAERLKLMDGRLGDTTSTFSARKWELYNFHMDWESTTGICEKWHVRMNKIIIH